MFSKALNTGTAALWRLSRVTERLWFVRISTSALVRLSRSHLCCRSPLRIRAVSASPGSPPHFSRLLHICESGGIHLSDRRRLTRVEVKKLRGDDFTAVTLSVDSQFQEKTSQHMILLWGAEDMCWCLWRSPTDFVFCLSEVRDQYGGLTPALADLWVGATIVRLLAGVSEWHRCLFKAIDVQLADTAHGFCKLSYSGLWADGPKWEWGYWSGREWCTADYFGGRGEFAAFGNVMPRDVAQLFEISSMVLAAMQNGCHVSWPL